jgi:hypothetical protein
LQNFWDTFGMLFLAIVALCWLACLEASLVRDRASIVNLLLFNPACVVLDNSFTSAIASLTSGFCLFCLANFCLYEPCRILASPCQSMFLTPCFSMPVACQSVSPQVLMVDMTSTSLRSSRSRSVCPSCRWVLCQKPLDRGFGTGTSQDAGRPDHRQSLGTYAERISERIGTPKNMDKMI